MSDKKYISENTKLMKEWDFEQNNEIGLLPNQLTLGSNKKAWWICSKNHKYLEVIYKKAKGKPCPYCTNRRVLIGYNDIPTLYPKLAQEWDYDKNDFVDIISVVVGSNKKVWWKCATCGNEWLTRIKQRTQRKSGCPKCGLLKGASAHHQTVLDSKGSLDNPLLLQEWDYESNGDLLPTQVTNGSSKSVGWICSKCGYKWYAKINNRAVLGRGCPCCANKTAVQGVNDLATTHPELAKEWDYEKNINLTPQEVTYGSGQKVYWICPKGHKYQATILHRTSGTNCPICNSGRQTSFAEQSFLFYIKKIHPDTISRYTDIFDNGMELDIYIPSMKTAIEYDGIYWHRSNRKREEIKYEICQKSGIKLIRIKENKDDDINGIADTIFYFDKLDDKQYLNQMIIFVLQHLEMWSGYFYMHPIDVNIFRDEFEIRKYMTELKGGSIAEVYPQLVEEWCYEKNGDLLPSMFSFGSSQKVWWKCSICGNIWLASINHRVNGTGCNVCYRKYNRGENHVEAIKIFQYSIDGDFIKEWGCIAEASRELKINNSNISMCAKHYRDNAGSYRWEYFYKERLGPIIKIKKNRKGLFGKRILQIDDDGNVIKEFISLNEAERQLGINATSISKAINGHIRTAGGYHWKQK